MLIQDAAAGLAVHFPTRDMHKPLLADAPYQVGHNQQQMLFDGLVAPPARPSKCSSTGAYIQVACRQLSGEYLRVLAASRLQREVRPMQTADRDRELMAILQQVSLDLLGQLQVQQALRRNELHVPDSQPMQFTSPQRF
jgi:hypothetical protein